MALIGLHGIELDPLEFSYMVKQEVWGINCWIFWKSEKLVQSTSEIDSLEIFCN